jgi:hypothetical protein
MYTPGYNHGNTAIVPIYRSTPAVITGGMKTTLSLDKMPRTINDMEYAVKGFWLRIPQPSFDLTASKQLDLVSLSQLFAAVTLKLAGGTPAEVNGGNRALFESIDGYRLFNALAFMTGVPLYRSSPGDVRLQSLSTIDAAVSTSTSTLITQSNTGWGALQGPFGAADGTGTTTWTEEAMFFFPVGMKYGEQQDRNAIPSSWFSGDHCGCGRKTDPGLFEFTLSALVDTKTVTFGAANCDLYAEVFMYPKDQVPVPLIMNIKVNRESGNFDLQRGIRSIFSFDKQLSSGGMQTVDYTTVYVKDRGMDLVCEGDVVLNRTHIQRQLEGDYQRNGFPVTRSALALASAGAARYITPGEIMLLHRDSTLHAPGSIDQPTNVQVKVTGETQFDYVDAVWVPNNLAGVQRALELNGNPSLVASPSTKNGNNTNLPESIARAIPAKLVPGKASTQGVSLSAALPPKK